MDLVRSVGLDRLRDSWSQGRMRPTAIIIGDELADGGAKMALVHRNDEIQTFGPDGPNDALAESICGWRADWSSESAYTEILQRGINCGGEYRVAVMDHESIG